MIDIFFFAKHFDTAAFHMITIKFVLSGLDQFGKR